ncbi:MAG: pentapeptide repeat-containing protein [Nitrosopumilus sp.]|nr:pentapeptide repeat-containing protein [Nitrosopumilus sp.]
MVGQKKALIVAVSKYDDDRLDRIQYVKNDGDQMYDTLTSLGYEIPAERKLVGNVDFGTMRRTIIKFFSDPSLEPEDTLLFYYSGHGDTNGRKRFFCSSQYDRKTSDLDGVPFSIITEQAKDTNSKRVVAIIDSCFSGGLELDSDDGKAIVNAERQGDQAINDEYGGSQGFYVLASSLSDKKSFKHPEKDLSSFTHFVMEGLKGDKGSYDEEGYVTPEKLDEYIFKKLKNLIGGKPQKPQRTTSRIAGKLILAEHKELARETSRPIEEKLTEWIKDEKVDKFNKFRKENQYKEFVLENINLSNKNLWKIDLRSLNVRKINFSCSNLRDSIFYRSTLFNVEFFKSNLNNVELSNAIVSRCRFSETSLLDARIKYSDFSGCSFSFGHLSNVDFSNSNLTGVNFAEAYMEDGNFTRANLTGACLTHAMLKNANFTDANLIGADLTDADLTGAKTTGCKGLDSD